MSPPILHLEALLIPIAERAPAGRDLRTDSEGRVRSTSEILNIQSDIEGLEERDRLESKIRERKTKQQQTKDPRAREVISYDIRQLEEDRKALDPRLKELKSRNWSDVIDEIQRLLREKSKDLELANWLTLALFRAHGGQGLYEGLALSRELIDRFWKEFHPIALASKPGSLPAHSDPGWAEPRLGILSEFDVKLAEHLHTHVLTHSNDDEGEDISFNTWDAAARSPSNDKSLDAVRRGGTMFVSAVDRKPAAEWIHAQQIFIACAGELTAIQAVLGKHWEESFGKALSGALLDQSSAALKALLELLDHVCVYKQPKQPDAENPTAAGAGAVPSISGGNTAVITSRADALHRLAQIALFFHVTEPYSPVAYLLDRAVSWGNRDLQQWLREMLSKNHGSALESLNETLGIPPPRSE